MVSNWNREEDTYLLKYLMQSKYLVWNFSRYDSQGFDLFAEKMEICKGQIRA